MAKIRCPNCTKVINVSKWDCDYVHDCSDMPKISVLAKQDVPIIGPWQDGDGTSNTDPKLSRVPTQAGIVDKLDMNDGKVEHPERVPPFTDRGNPADTTRERNVQTYIKLRSC